MPTNLSNLIQLGGNLKTVSLALSASSGSASQGWASSGAFTKIAFNSLTDPYSLCTVNQSLSTFTLAAGTYGIETYQGGFYASGWGGPFVTSYRLTLGSTTYDIWRQHYGNNVENNGQQVGAPVFSILPATTTCYFEFAQSRTSGASWQFYPLGTGGAGTAGNINEWFKLNIYKIR